MKYTVSEVAAMLGVNEETIRRDIRKGKLKASISSKKEGYTMETSALIAAYGQHFAEHADRQKEEAEYFRQRLEYYESMADYYRKRLLELEGQ